MVWCLRKPLNPRTDTWTEEEQQSHFKLALPDCLRPLPKLHRSEYVLQVLQTLGQLLLHGHGQVPAPTRFKYFRQHSKGIGQCPLDFLVYLSHHQKWQNQQNNCSCTGCYSLRGFFGFCYSFPSQTLPSDSDSNRDSATTLWRELPQLGLITIQKSTRPQGIKAITTHCQQGSRVLIASKPNITQSCSVLSELYSNQFIWTSRWSLVELSVGAFRSEGIGQE